MLKSELATQPITFSSEDPPVGLHACAIGNSFGLGLVSAVELCQPFTAECRLQRHRGFHTDGCGGQSRCLGGALVDPQGHLIGLIDGIFTKEADIDAGVNFAISVPLLSNPYVLRIQGRTFQVQVSLPGDDQPRRD